MSYDIEIRSDDHYSSGAQFDTVAVLIASLPFITPNGSSGFCYAVDNRLYMEIDLELVDGDGNSLGDGITDTINCIRCHIPYAYMYPDHNYISAYFTTCLAIAQYLQWQAIDLQTGHDLFDG